MRQPYKKQITIGSKKIKEIEFDLNCWHEIIPILKVSVGTIERISNLVIGEGHAISPKAIEKGRGDSFVVQTNIHHPTDANLRLDGITRMLILVSRLALIFSIVGYSGPCRICA